MALQEEFEKAAAEATQLPDRPSNEAPPGIVRLVQAGDGRRREWRGARHDGIRRKGEIQCLATVERDVPAGSATKVCGPGQYAERSVKPLQAIFELSLQQLVERIRTGRIKARDLLASVYDNIERYDGQLNVFLSLVDKNRAMRWAEAIDGKAVKGEPLGKLAGIPVALKDNIAIEDAQLKTILRLANPGKLSSALQCDGCGKAAPGRRFDHRQNQYG